MPLRLFKRDVSLMVRRGGGTPAAMGFLLLVYTLFAFGMGPEALNVYGAQASLVAVLLACLLALPGLFERDHEDGTLEQYRLQPVALEWLVLAKLAAFWAACALPLSLTAPLIALVSGMPPALALGHGVSIMLASLSVASVGMFGAALTLGARGAGFAQALIVLPLAVPPLIFAASGAEGVWPLLAAMALAGVPLSCFICAALLRMSED